MNEKSQTELSQSRVEDTVVQLYWAVVSRPVTPLERMAGTTRLELATSAVTVQRPEVTGCNFTAPIATLGALRNPRGVLLHPNCTQIRRFSVRVVELLY
jgi:hypothetical protein